MTRPLPEKIYTAEPALRRPGRFASQMWKDLRSCRELAWRLTVRDIRAQYRQSALGILWAFLPPVATALVFVLLNRHRVIHVGETAIPYTAFALFGTVLWQVFVDSLNAPLKIVTASKALLAKIDFPREALILSGIGQTLFGVMVRMSILSAVLVIYALPLRWSLLPAFLALLVLILLGTAIGVLITPIGALYTDVAQGLPVVTGLWFFLTPVVYPPPATPFFSWLTTLNPVSPVLMAARDWATLGTIQHPGSFYVVTGLALLALTASWIVYRLAFPIIVERMQA